MSMPTLKTIRKGGLLVTELARFNWRVGSVSMRHLWLLHQHGVTVPLYVSKVIRGELYPFLDQHMVEHALQEETLGFTREVYQAVMDACGVFELFCESTAQYDELRAVMHDLFEEKLRAAEKAVSAGSFWTEVLDPASPLNAPL